MPAMELTPEAAHYVIGFYGSLMTDVERRAQRHLSATMKATLGRSDVAAQKDAQRSRIHSKFLSEDPNVLRLAADGYEAFAQRTAARILQECGAEARFNRCPALWGISTNADREAMPSLPSRLARGGNLSVNADCNS
jgi:hypothetical protein